MAIAFSVLSLKRNRSTSTNSKAHSFTNVEPVSKLSKLKSGFSIFSKITQSLQQQQQDCDKRTGLFQYFRSNHDHDHIKYSKNTYESDKDYEYNHYHNTKRHDHERNIHTLPAATTKKLTGILIKRSGTNPTTIAFKRYDEPPEISHASRNRTYSNATISNMTINSEDLTAKEFADIAGIRILPEEEYTIDDDIDVIEGNRKREDDDNEGRKFSQDEDIVMNNATLSSRYTSHRMSVLSCASFSSYSTQNKLKIWDNEFWSHPEGRSTNCSLDRKVSVRSTATTTNLVEPPILHELRRMNTTGNDGFIKKGRFEIHLGSTLDGDKIDPSTSLTAAEENYTDSTLSFSDAGVLEWKRKGKKN